jgi:HlyD family secretion protein
MEQALHDLLNPTQLQVANGQQVMADAQEALERLQDPTALDVANAQQAVAVARVALRDRQEALDELLDPDIDTLQDAVRDAEFDLAGAEQDVELTDIGSATSALENAQDTLETMQERRVSVQKALDACTVHKLEQEDERDVHDYMQLTVSEEVVHGGFIYLEGSVYEVFEETGQTMLDTFGSIVTRQSYRVCDPDRAVTVDGVRRTLAEADEDVVAAEDRVREAELQLGSTRMSNTTALDVATEELEDAREALDDTLAGSDPIDLAVAHAAVDDAAGELGDAEEQLEQLLVPQPGDVAIATGNMDDAQKQLEQLLNPRPADVAVAKATLADVQDELAKLLNPDPDDVTVAEVTLADAKEKLADLLGGPDPDDIAAADAKVLAVQTTLDSVRVVAPFDSTVVETQSQVGDYVNNNSIALTLADLSYLEVQVNVSELDVNSIFVGQEATLTLDAVSDQTFAGRVADVGFLGSVSQGVVTFPVTVVVDGPDPALKPGMTAAVSIVTERREDVLVVPNRAIRVSGGQRTVTVLWEGQQIVVPVTLGLLSETMSEVIEGELREGDAVVISQPTTTQGGFGSGRGGMGGGFGGFGGH